MRYGYTRTSTTDKQDDDLQRRALVDAGVDERLEDGGKLVVWRIDQIGRSMIAVITTVKDLTDRGVAVRSLSDGVNPATKEGRLLLGQMTAFAEYERELIQERVQAGVDVARARGVRFGRPAPDPKKVARNLRAVEYLVSSEGLGVMEAAKTIGWSKATYYRHRAQAQESA